MPGLQFDAYLVSKVVKALDFMPDLKVARLMPVVIDHTSLRFYQQSMKLLVSTEAYIGQYLSSLTVSI